MANTSEKEKNEPEQEQENERQPVPESGAEQAPQEQQPSAQEGQAAQDSCGGQDEREGELASMSKKYNELNDRYLRVIAEYDNFRKRSQREKEAVYPTAVAGTVEKFLPVMDNFERAMACECADAEFKKGVDMIFESLKKSLCDLAVEEIGTVGEPFDANLHNAVMHIEDESLDKNVVAAVLQKGYRIGDRVIRYAMVTVAN